MTWPTGPPPMPSPGWYDDPELPWTWRYWDGASWTEHRAPMWVPPGRDPTSFSSWFERSVAFGTIAVRRVGVLLVAVWMLFGAASWVLVVGVFDGDRGRELRRLLEIDQNVFEPTGSSSSIELTDAEAERAWELLQDIFWSAVPWLIALTVVFVVVSAWSIALVVRVVQPHGADPATDQTPERLAGIMASALRRVPAVLGSGVVVVAVYAVVWAAASIPVVLVAVADGGGAAIVLTTVFVVLLVFAVTVWLWVRLTLASVIAAVGGHGLGVRRSWRVTQGRVWFVAGRLLVAGLIAGAAGGVVNIVTGFGQFLGFAVFLAIVIVLQAFAVAVSMIVTACGHLVTIDQLGDATHIGSLRNDAPA